MPAFQAEGPNNDAPVSGCTRNVLGTTTKCAISVKGDRTKKRKSERKIRKKIRKRTRKNIQRSHGILLLLFLLLIFFFPRCILANFF
jgi:hypothetical protein